VLPLRPKSDAPIEFEKWVNRLRNGTRGNVRTVMLDSTKELVAGRTKGLCDERSIQLSRQLSHRDHTHLHLNGVAERLVGIMTSGTRGTSRDSGLPLGFGRKRQHSWICGTAHRRRQTRERRHMSFLRDETRCWSHTFGAWRR